MRKYLALLMPMALVAAQAPAPVLSIPVKHHDFGKVSGDQPVSHRFKVTNTGTAPLQIKSVDPSCGCTSTVLGQWWLKPGESTEVEARFNPKGFRGLIRKSIKVVSDDPQNPTQVLTFDAEVLQEVVVSTEYINFDGATRSGTPPKATVHLSSQGKTLRILSAKAAGSPFLVTTVRQGDHEADVDILFDAKRAPEQKVEGIDNVVIQTDNPRMPSVTVGVQWSIKQFVTADPPRVAFSEAAGIEHTAKVTLRSATRRPFRVLKAHCTNPHLKVLGLNQAPSHEPSVTVVMDKEAERGLYNETVVLTLDEPDQPTMQLRVSASLR